MEQKSITIIGAGIAGLSAKVIVVYESKYGNTKLLAETIAEGMTEVGGIEAVVSEVKEVDLGKVTDYDAILAGSPNHIGGPIWGIKKFIGKLGKLPLGESSLLLSTHTLREASNKR